MVDISMFRTSAYPSDYEDGGQPVPYSFNPTAKWDYKEGFKDGFKAGVEFAKEPQAND